MSVKKPDDTEPFNLTKIDKETPSDNYPLLIFVCFVCFCLTGIIIALIVSNNGYRDLVNQIIKYGLISVPSFVCGLGWEKALSVIKKIFKN